MSSYTLPGSLTNGKKLIAYLASDGYALDPVLTWALSNRQGLHFSPQACVYTRHSDHCCPPPPPQPPWTLPGITCTCPGKNCQATRRFTMWNCSVLVLVGVDGGSCPQIYQVQSQVGTRQWASLSGRSGQWGNEASEEGKPWL